MAIVKDVNVNGKTVFDTNNLLVYLTDHLKTGGGKYVAGLSSSQTTTLTSYRQSR